MAGKSQDLADLILEVRDLSYSYGEGEEVLKKINLQIRSGEKIAVLGPNGAGKSTFFLNMNGVYRWDGGEVFLSGIKIDKKSINELRKNVGYVFQEPDNQIVGSTVMSEVAFGPMNLKLDLSEVEERTNNALHDMKLEEYKERPPHYLSGGEKKRVSIADVLAMQPKIILFDEPCASLDPVNQKMFEELLHKLEALGKTIIISTHDVDFAYRWADRIIVFTKGEIIADDIPIKVFTSEDVLEKASLTKPVLLQIYEIMTNNCTGDYADAPRCIEEFKEWFKIRV